MLQPGGSHCPRDIANRGIVPQNLEDGQQRVSYKPLINKTV
jgi:hypothetical protein